MSMCAELKLDLSLWLNVQAGIEYIVDYVRWVIVNVR